MVYVQKILEDMKTCIIIPAYNESKNIQKIINEINNLNLGLEVIVINDGSSDDTPNLARNCGAQVISNQKNLGKGISLSKGFAYALKEGNEIIITMDGDGQHLVMDLGAFIQAAENLNADIFIGNRMLKTKDMPILRFLTNRLLSFMISSICKQNIPDTQCGFRLFKRKVLEKIKLKTKNFEAESEILIQATALGFRIESLPIKTVYQGQKSQINPFIDTLRFIKFILKESWTTKF